jgi:hypothetical protein
MRINQVVILGIVLLVVSSGTSQNFLIMDETFSLYVHKRVDPIIIEFE